MERVPSHQEGIYSSSYPADFTSTQRPLKQMIQRNEPEREAVKNYKFWKGKQRFFCSGRLESGPNILYPIASLILINLPGGLSLAFPLRELSDHYNYWVLGAGIFIQILASAFLLKTALRDPGTIPSREYLRDTYERPIDFASNIHYNWMIVLNQNLFKLKFCATCEAYRAPRSIHCDDCNACIQRLDHHCPWVGNCVGKRNYKYFITFINLTGLMIAYQIAIALWNLDTLAKDYRSPDVSQAESWRLAMRESPYSMILLIYSFGFSLFIFTLASYHHYLIIVNETTNENLKKTYRHTGNPFRRSSCIDHWIEVCKPRQKRMLWKPKRTAQDDNLFGANQDRREIYMMAGAGVGGLGNARNSFSTNRNHIQQRQQLLQDICQIPTSMDQNIAQNEAQAGLNQIQMVNHSEIEESANYESQLRESFNEGNPDIQQQDSRALGIHQRATGLNHSHMSRSLIHLSGNQAGMTIHQYKPNDIDNVESKAGFTYSSKNKQEAAFIIPGSGPDLVVDEGGRQINQSHEEEYNVGIQDDTDHFQPDEVILPPTSQRLMI